jgi:hypothetical protein
MIQQTSHHNSTSIGMILLMRGHLLVAIILVVSLFYQSVFASNEDLVTLPQGSVGLVIKREKAGSSLLDFFDSSPKQDSLIIKMTHGAYKGRYFRVPINDDSISQQKMSFSSLSTYYKKNDIISEKDNSQIDRYDVAKFSKPFDGELISNSEGEDAQYDTESDSQMDFEYPLKVLEASTPENCEECMALINGSSNTSSRRLVKSGHDILQATRSQNPNRSEARTLSKVPFKKTYWVKNKYGKRINKDLSPACRIFIDQDGTLGPIGVKIQETLLSDGKYAKAFLSPGRLPEKFCPNFNKMNNGERLKAWIWHLMDLSNEESTCNPNAFHDNKYKKDKYGNYVLDENGDRIRIGEYGWGLFAAELSPELRRSNKRGKMCMGNIKTVDVQITCAVDTMYKQKLSRGIPLSSRERQYWSPYFNPEVQIIPNMKIYEPCWRKN